MKQDTWREFRAEVETAVSAALKELKVETPTVIDKAPEGKGDLAFPCFPLAKQLRKAANAIAQDLCAKIKPRGMIDKVEVSGGYVNFHVKYEDLAQTVLDWAVASKDKFGSGEQKKTRILLEHTSANPTGPLHVGRARNPIIGDSLARIIRLAGYPVTTEFYVNDVGRQVITMAWGVKNLKLETEPDRDADHFRYVLYYQQANKRMEEDPKALEETDAMLHKLEHGDPETVKLARETCERVLSGIMESLRRINIDVNGFTWESKYVQDGSVDGIIEQLKKSEFARELEGAYHLELESFGITGRETKWVFTRSDGTSLYTTRDLAYHIEKFKRTDVAINILGEDQRLAMQELAAALSIMGINKKPEIVYYAFVSLPEGRMSTRRGTVVYLDDLLDEAVDRAYEEVKKRRTDLPEERMKEIARIVGTGALRYNVIRIQAEKQIVFKWEDALNIEGNSAPFIQYAHARACSILRKAREEGAGGAGPFDAKLLTHEQEKSLLKTLASMPSVISDCAENRRAHTLAAYAQDLAAHFNQFYRYVPVLKAEGGTRSARLALVEASMWAMRNSLTCLGIEAPQEM